MNWNELEKLELNRPLISIPARVLWIGGILAGFSLAWWLIPHGALFWLSLPVLALISWLASFGWRHALRALLNTIRQLEQF